MGEPLRRTSSEILPTPPAVSKDVVGARRVRSGPKERSAPVVDSVTRVRSGPLERGDPAAVVNEQGDAQSSSASERRKKGGERTSSGDKRRKKSQVDDEKPKDELVSYYEENVKPLLSQMEERFAEKNVKDLCQDCLKLWNALEKKGLIGKASGSFSARRRGEILRTVFKFLDISDPRLLLRLGRLILSVSDKIYMYQVYHKGTWACHTPVKALSEGVDLFKYFLGLKLLQNFFKTSSNQFFLCFRLR